MTSSLLSFIEIIHWLPVCIPGRWFPLHYQTVLACDSLFILTFHWRDQLTVHLWHVMSSPSLSFIGKIHWLFFPGRWFPVHHKVPLKRSSDCTSLACDSLFILRFFGKINWLFIPCMDDFFILKFHFKDPLIVHPRHVILSSLLPLIGKKVTIDCASMAYDSLFIARCYWKDLFTVHQWHVIPSSSLRFIGKIIRLFISGMWRPLHRNVSLERSIDCASLARDSSS